MAIHKVGYVAILDVLGFSEKVTREGQRTNLMHISTPLST